MTDDAELLASAYLDGAATPDERARVESDPALMREVERLRLVRDVVADVEPAPISLREEQLAVALAAWEELPPSADATPPAAGTTSAVDRARRWSSTGWVAAAAAALLLVVGAGVVLRQTDQTSGDDAASEAPAGTESFDETDEEAAADTVEEAGEEAAGDSAVRRRAATVDEEGLAEEVEAQERASTQEAAEDLEVEYTDEADRGPPPETELEDLPLLTSTEDLGAFAQPAFDAPATTLPPIEPADEVAAEDAEATSDGTVAAAEVIDVSSCEGLGVDVVVAPAGYGADESSAQLVVVGVDRSAAAAIAYDPETCAVVATAPLD